MKQINFKIVGIIIIIVIVVALVIKNLSPQPQNQTQKANKEENTTQVEIISTNPSPLDGATILPNQDITINFNKPLENAGQLKIKFDPTIEYQIKLSNDRKTATISAPFELGRGYTLFILGESKFDGSLRLGGDKVFHLKTIDFKSG